MNNPMYCYVCEERKPQKDMHIYSFKESLQEFTGICNECNSNERGRAHADALAACCYDLRTRVKAGLSTITPRNPNVV